MKLVILLSAAALLLAATALARTLNEPPPPAVSPEELSQLRSDLAALQKTVADLPPPAAPTVAPPPIDEAKLRDLVRTEMRSQGGGRWNGGGLQDADPAQIKTTLVKDAGLPEEKAAQVAELMTANRQKIRELFAGGGDRNQAMAAMETMRKDFDNQVAAVLDADQAAAFAKWMARNGPRGFGGRGNRPPGDRPASEPAKPLGDAPATGKEF
jgi:hypothetical protein